MSQDGLETSKLSEVDPFVCSEQRCINLANEAAMDFDMPQIPHHFSQFSSGLGLSSQLGYDEKSKVASRDGKPMS